MLRIDPKRNFFDIALKRHIFGIFSLIYNWILWKLAPWFAKMTNTFYVKAPGVYERVVPMTSDDTYLSKFFLERTIWFKSELDLNRLLQTLRTLAESFPTLASSLVVRENGKLFLK